MFRQKVQQLLHPLVRRAYIWYAKKPRKYRWHGLTVQLYPSVFHPWVHFSTHIFLDFLEEQALKNKRILELGAGSGLISCYLAQQGNEVVASDINPIAVRAIQESATLNNLQLEVIHSDLFAKIDLSVPFDFILINPPFFARDAQNDFERAYFCGIDFEYFERLFTQVSDRIGTKSSIWMILSEDCELQRIRDIGLHHNTSMKLVFEKTNNQERHEIYELISKKNN